MHLLLIRHGESQNNVIEAKYGDGEVFATTRSSDPELSERGFSQADSLGVGLGQLLHAERQRVTLMCSPMLRACQTAQPLGQILDLPVIVSPDLFENGGMYKRVDGRKQSMPGLKPRELQERFPSYDVSLVPTTGLTVVEKNLDESLVRAKKVAQWIAARAADPSMEEAILVIVAHVDFIGLLSQTLLTPLVETPPQHTSYWEMNNTAINHMFIGAKIGTRGSFSVNHASLSSY
jgi:broad specificity phosphatase PhoE